MHDIRFLSSDSERRSAQIHPAETDGTPRRGSGGGRRGVLYHLFQVVDSNRIIRPTVRTDLERPIANRRSAGRVMSRCFSGVTYPVTYDLDIELKQGRTYERSGRWI